jgi:Right handed beta helix region
MLRRLQVLLLFAALPVLAAGRVVFVDNSRPPGGDGSAQSPYATLAQGVGTSSEVVYVAQTPAPYQEIVTLRKGQMLVGSAYGLDAIAAEMKTNFGVALPAQNDTGPIIRGTIALMGDNIVAGCTMIVDHSSSGIVASAVDGRIALRGMSFQTSQRSFAIVLQAQHGPVSISGGSIVAANDGSGILIASGDGEVTIERFPLSGAFGTAVRIFDRPGGAVTFRNGSSIRTDDASDDAIVVMNAVAKASVTFADRIQIRGRRRGLVSSNVKKLVVSGTDSWLVSSGSAALDLEDSSVDVVLDSVSSDGAVQGVVVDKVRGRLEVRGVNGKPGTGGTIQGAKMYGLRVTQSSNVRFANMTITASGSITRPAPATTSRRTPTLPQAKCAGEFDVNTTAPCNAALYIRHLETASFENIVIDGGGAMGLNANNIRDVKFDNLEIRTAGDESFEAGVLLQELREPVTFTRCRFTDNAGSEVMIEQRFNKGRVTFDQCVFAAPARPLIAESMIDVHALAGSSLEVDIRGSDLHDNAGSGITATASGTATFVLSIADTALQRLGTGGVILKAVDAAHAALVMTRSQITALAAPVVVDGAASGTATLCADLATNAFTGGRPPIRLAAKSPQASLHVVTNAADGAGISSALAAANGGAAAAIEALPPALAVVQTCP